MREVKIKNIKKLEGRNDRYDLTVPKNNNFFANGVLIHNTSGRTGNVYAKLPLTSKQEWWNKYFGWLKKYEHQEGYQVVSGSRRVVLDPDQSIDKGFYSGKTFRIDIHNKIKEAGLPCSVTLYYEIVGFDEQGKSIMPSQSVEKIGDKKLRKLIKKQYGDLMTYSYGCRADDPDPSKRYRVNVYRATVTTVNGEIYELSWPQVKELCSSLGLETVPDLAGPIVYKPESKMSDDWKYLGIQTHEEQLLSLVDSFLDQPEGLDGSHIREGVCIRVEPPKGGAYILKDKGFIFKYLEGLIHDDPNMIDTEEVESY